MNLWSCVLIYKRPTREREAIGIIERHVAVKSTAATVFASHHENMVEGCCIQVRKTVIVTGGTL